MGAVDIWPGCTLKTVSRASPATPRNFEIVSNNLTAAICEAEAPCSANSALYPSSSLTLSLQSTTRPLYTVQNSSESTSWFLNLVTWISGGFWFLHIFRICFHQVTWPNSDRTKHTTSQYSFLSKLMDPWLVLRGIQNVLQFPLLWLKHGRRSSFPRWTFLCFSGTLHFSRIVSLDRASWSMPVVPFALSLPGQIHKNMFRFWRPRAAIFAFCLLLLSKSTRVLLCLLSDPSEKSTCSAVDTRGCRSPWSSISGSFPVPLPKQAIKRSSWVFDFLTFSLSFRANARGHLHPNHYQKPTTFLPGPAWTSSSGCCTTQHWANKSKIIECSWCLLMLKNEKIWYIICLLAKTDVLQEVDLPLEVGRSNLHVSYGDFRIQSFTFSLVHVEHESWIVQFSHAGCDVNLCEPDITSRRKYIPRINVWRLRPGSNWNFSASFPGHFRRWLSVCPMEQWNSMEFASMSRLLRVEMPVMVNQLCLSA